jgi:hypothetical protein
MLCSIRELDGFALAATFEGEIGQVNWVIRHLVVDTGGWLRERDMLISPHSTRSLDLQGSHLDVALTHQQAQDAPDIGTAPPVSRQQQNAYYDYYGFPPGGKATRFGGTTAYPLARAILGEPASSLDEQVDAKRAEADPHLRSSVEVLGYRASRPATTLSATSTTFSSTSACGASTSRWWTRAAGCPGALCSSRRSGSNASIGRSGVRTCA